MILIRRFWVVFSFLLAGFLPAQLLGANRQVLHDHVPNGLARLQVVEPLPAGTQLNLAIALPLRNRGALTNLLRDLYDPASPRFHHYLTAAEFTAQFGPTEADYQALREFARDHNLAVTGTHPNRMLLEVSGSVADIEKAFAIKFHRYRHPSEPRIFYAPDSEPSLELDTPVLSIAGLDDYFLPRPASLNVRWLKRIGGAGADRSSGIASGAESFDTTNGTPFATGTGPRGSFIARDFRAAYAPGVALDGSGQSVGLFELDGFFPADITAYENLAGLPNVPINHVLLNPLLGAAGSKNLEVALDIDMTISMAPGLSQVIVYDGRMGNTILNRMATDNLARQLSCSWSFGNQVDPAREQIFKEFAAQGQSFFQAVGDNGAYSGPANPPTDDAFITVVGGTVLTTGPNGVWTSESAWPQGSGGVSTSYPIPIWQMGLSMAANKGSTTMRNIPDVSCLADSSIWLVADNGLEGVVGGTSAATPLWAAFTALVNQQAAANGQPSVGFLNPALYAIGQGGSYSASFHDITAGNNTNASSPAKFFAVPGYDLCTGWGTPSGSNLIAALLAPPDALRIAPTVGGIASGPVGGPFGPGAFAYSLTNSGAGSLSWTLANTSAWISASSTGGVLVAGGPSINVTFSLNAAAGSLSPGSYTATLWFTNLNDGFAQQRQLTLDVITPPAITSQPTNLTVPAGASASFAVVAASDALVLYQWRLNGTNLSDGGNRFGSSTATLTISNATPIDAGTYSVVLSNLLGSLTSTGAVLTVASSAPVLVQQPASQSVLPAATATLTLTAIGSEPLFYQWQKDGIDLADAGNLSGSSTSGLTIGDAGALNAGTYSVIVSNILGTTSSTGAVLTVVADSSPEISLAPVYSFTGGYDGANPNGLALGLDGNWHGTTQHGGTNSVGTIFQMSPNGSPATAYSFTGTNDGALPFGTLIQGTDGNWYGTTLGGGAFQNGTAFKFGAAGLTTLVAFAQTNGDLPYAGLIIGGDGNFYGTTYQGGAVGYGTAFRLGTNGTVTTLASFNNANGAFPYAGLAGGTDGNFYGATFQSASSGGTVFKVSTNGALTTLFSFSGTNGVNPHGTLVQGDDGNFYGTASSGGSFSNGTLFRVSASGVFANLHTFTGGSDGGRPLGGLLLASDGNFYGTTAFGGTYGKGTVFKLTPGGAFTTLAWFDGFNGANPETALAQFPNGSFYGTTQNGGANGHGAIYRFGIDAPLQITGQPVSQSAYLGSTVILHVATYGSLPAYYQWSVNGSNLADGGVISGSNARSLVISNVAPANAGVYSVAVSNTFGSVTSDGAFLSILVSPPLISAQPTSQTLAPGATALFSVTVAGDEPLFFQWQKNGVNLNDGGIISGAATSSLSLSNVVETNNGTYSVQVSNALGLLSSTGAVLTVIPPSTIGTRVTTLYSFTGGTDGRTPNGIVQGTDGRLYGTTTSGGSGHAGTAFSTSTNVGPPTILAAFGGSVGVRPAAALLQGADGNFYGTTEYGGVNTSGNVFRLSTSGVLTNFYSFTGGIDGNQPATALTQGSDGNFYGTTAAGGAFGSGNIFKLTANGTLTNLYSFTGGNDGGAPDAIIQAADGNFYGVTGGGGAYGLGSAFKVTTNGAITTLDSFTGGSDGSVPTGALAQGSDGNFYGVTKYNIISGFRFYGTIFKITPAGAFTTLYPFNYGDGTYPAAGLIQGGDGNFYGTTYSGGDSGDGTVFAITPNGAFTTLVSFDGFDDGAHPEAAVVQGVDGNLYGTTTTGGPNNGGTIFKINIISAPLITDQPASQTAFTGANVSFSVAVFGAAPLQYHWTKSGTSLTDGGNIFGSSRRVLSVVNVSSNDAGAYSVLVSNSLGSMTSAVATLTITSSPPAFVTQPASQIALPGATVLFSAAAIGDQPLFYQWLKNGGNLSDGGTVSGSTTGALNLNSVSAADAATYSIVVSNSLGSITSTGAVLSVPFTAPGIILSNLYSFSGGNDGGNPNGLTMGCDGQLYGTTQAGGTNGSGTIFRLAATGAPATLYSFTGGNDGAAPYARLTVGSDGNFYGTAFSGAAGDGTVFQLTTNGVVNPLYSFTGGNDGGSPVAELTQGTNNVLYGTAESYGHFGFGVLFEVTTNGTFTSLYAFGGGNDGGQPRGGLARDVDGGFFGTTSADGAGGAGTVFRLTEAGGFTNLHSFSGGAEGNSPVASLVRGADGNFYGTTQNGGASGNGTIFKVNRAGTLTELHSFSGFTDGTHPVAGLLGGGDGNFYGAASAGGPYSAGTLFQITPGGALTPLAWFNGTNGANPEATLVQGADGGLYGTTLNGGANGAGTIFRVSVPFAPMFRSAIQTTGSFQLTWSAVAGRVYQLQFTSSITHLNWQNLGSPLAASTGIMTGIDSSPSGTQRFYRVILTQ